MHAEVEMIRAIQHGVDVHNNAKVSFFVHSNAQRLFAVLKSDRFHPDGFPFDLTLKKKNQNPT